MVAFSKSPERLDSLINHASPMKGNMLKQLLMIFLAAHVSAHALKPEIGERPEPLTRLEYVDGTKFDIQNLRGKPAVIYFGADWCGPCRVKGRPATERVAKKYGPLGLQVIFVSMDDNKFRQNKVEEARQLGLSIVMPSLEVCPPHKCPSGLRDLKEVYLYPTAFVLDAEGVLRAKMDHGQGVQGGLEKAVVQVLKQSGVSIPP